MYFLRNIKEILILSYGLVNAYILSIKEDLLPNFLHNVENIPFFLLISLAFFIAVSIKLFLF